MSFTDKIKAKAEELDLQTKAAKLKEQAAAAAAASKEKAAEMAHQHHDKIDAVVEKAGATVNEKTGGKYAKHIDVAKEKAKEGVSKVAEQRPAATKVQDAVHDAADTITDPAAPVVDPTEGHQL